MLICHLLLYVMLLCCHTLVNIRAIHHAAPSYVVATLGQVTTVSVIKDGVDTRY